MNRQSVLDVLDEVGTAFLHTARYGARTLQRMSWPALLLACVLMAMILTLLPLALLLFTAFLLLKLAVGACILQRRNKTSPPERHS
jgi:hypothetical protein